VQGTELLNAVVGSSERAISRLFAQARACAPCLLLIDQVLIIPILKCVAVCCSVLQCIAVCCSVYSVLQRTCLFAQARMCAPCLLLNDQGPHHSNVAMCCSVLQRTRHFASVRAGSRVCAVPAMNQSFPERIFIVELACERNNVRVVCVRER